MIGPVRILCDEIGFPFDPSSENEAVFVAFVRGLVDEIADRRELQERISPATGKPPSAGSAEVLALTYEMLDASGSDRLEKAKAVHDAAWRLNPDEAYPTDHLIDMLSSCASAIRFGLEKPCRSRHAADAAQQVFKHRYGITLSDSNVSRWQKEWACTKLGAALAALSTTKSGNE